MPEDPQLGWIFVYDPSQVTLTATKATTPAGAPALEWFGGTAGSTGWKLQRSTSPAFTSATTVYQGPLRTFTDATGTGSTLYYRLAP